MQDSAGTYANNLRSSQRHSVSRVPVIANILAFDFFPGLDPVVTKTDDESADAWHHGGHRRRVVEMGIGWS